MKRERRRGGRGGGGGTTDRSEGHSPEISRYLTKQQRRLTPIQTLDDPLVSHGLHEAIHRAPVPPRRRRRRRRRRPPPSRRRPGVGGRIHHLHLHLHDLERVQHERADGPRDPPSHCHFQHAQLLPPRPLAHHATDLAVAQEEDGVLGHRAEQGRRDAPVQ